MRWLYLLVMAPLLFAVACDGGATFECSAEVACADNSEVCIDGTCQVRECSSSIDCPVEEVCTADGCQAGCENDNDCFPGDICDPEFKECTFGGCVDTHIDCGYKEFCNTLTGECYDAGGVYCRPCDPRNVVADCNGGEATGKNECWNNYCLVDCANGRECPSGFQCYPFTDRSGNVTAYQCLTYCWLYEGRGVGADAVPPPDGWQLPLNPSCAVEGMLPEPGAGK
ncbi:MAG: hypothetical protein AB8H79_13100 [Myxococcota bacterium]